MTKVLSFPKITDPRGNLSFVQRGTEVPFEIRRCFWIYDVPGGETRGGHAYRSSEEVIIALSGGFDVVMHDGHGETRHTLNRSYYGLHVPALTWRHMENFSTNAVALVLSSTRFSEVDYIRDFDAFLQLNKTQVHHSIQAEEQALVAEKLRFQESTVKDCTLINLPINHRDKGNITVAEGGINLPFHIRRVYYLYDIPGGESRGGHAHKALQQWIIAASGSFDVLLNDGKNEKKVSLNRPNQALRVVPGIWRELENFSSGAICLVLASEMYSESDYYRTFSEFKHEKYGY